MKATSDTNPAWYWLRKLKGSTAYLRIHANIVEHEINDDAGTRMEYEYDEIEIVVAIPEEVTTVEQFKDFIDSKEAEYVAKVSPSKPSQPQEEEEETNIRKKDINKIRKELKELT